jgi:hypothetical protein
MPNYEKISKKISQTCCHNARSGCFFAKAAQPCYCTFIFTYFNLFILEILALKMNAVSAMWDPELTLQDSKFFEPKKLELHFRPSAKYAASTHYIHVKVPFNFTELLQTPERIYDRYDKYIRIWPEPFKTETKQIVEVSHSCITDKVIDFIDLLDVLPRHINVTRTKHQFEPVTFRIASAGLTLASYNAIQISKLETIIAAKEKKVDHFIDITNLHKNHFKSTGNYAANQQGPICQGHGPHETKVFHCSCHLQMTHPHSLQPQTCDQSPTPYCST